MPIPSAYLIHGRKMLLHPLEKDIWVSRFLAHNLAYEPFETQWLTYLIRPGDVVLDIGAAHWLLHPFVLPTGGP